MAHYEAGATCVLVAEGFATGLVGTIAVTVLANNGGTAVTRTTSGIIEPTPAAGLYHGTVTMPGTAGTYTVRWDNGSISAGNIAVEQIDVTTTPVAVVNVGTAVFTYQGSDPGTFTYAA